MDERCRLCDRAGTHHLGSYVFCAEHYQKATHQRHGLWQADALSILLLLLFVLLVFALDDWIQPQFSPAGLLLAGGVLSLVPALVWLAFFYRRDRLEPEPRGKVVGQFILGGLLASAVSLPVTQDLFQLPRWLGSSPVWAQLLGGVLIVGFTQEYLKYAGTRFAIYNSPEFDEYTDGIIYTTATGLGFATVLNIAFVATFVATSGGVDLGLACIRIVLTALAHASFAGITGYFLGRQKFEDRPLWWMPLGLTVAASLNGLFFYFRSLLSQGGLGRAGGTPWLGLLLAAILAVAVTAFLSRTIRRDLAAVLALEEG